MKNKGLAVFFLLVGLAMAQCIPLLPLWTWSSTADEDFCLWIGGIGFVVLFALFIGTFFRQAAFPWLIRIPVLLLTIFTAVEIYKVYSWKSQMREDAERFDSMQRVQHQLDSIERYNRIDSSMHSHEDHEELDYIR